MNDVQALPSPCVVVLVGPGASGKTSWADAHFPPGTVVSSDRLRALVGVAEDDIEASTDAFALLDQLVARRLARKLTTVIDTLGLDTERRQGWLALARANGMPCYAVAFDTPAKECRERNRQRDKRIPVDVLNAQLRTWAAVRDRLDDEGFDGVLRPAYVRVVPEAFTQAQAAVERQQRDPSRLRFGLQLATFDWPGGNPAVRQRLTELAQAAEEAGFDALYVMDHFRQIPQIGRAWDAMLESYTTLAFLAGRTERVRLGTLVTGVTYRNVAHLGKIIATLDVLSGGRAVCGLGLGWFESEHRAYGWEFPPVRERYELLEDALRVLPLVWGKGAPAYEGKQLHVKEALSYPRPLQDRVPIILGGSGERRTLRLAARYADACNVFGNAETVRHKTEVLRAHCIDVDRDPSEVEVTQLSTVLIGTDDQQVRELVEQHRPRRQDPARYAASVNAGTVADQVGRFRELAEAGASEVMVRLPHLVDASSLEPIANVIRAFR
ncbi:TIGR03560 family F420-dependent LLM class oxidoreductase [Tenggerimyces flavus]|uniref:TIGR03560 family F420-dependent LLM class oxidoreductase n=1 Tax=Tenggerimyces flavus TaxID=1708749 RepID=A0ABV7YAF7_9ACTN|nr:TIGR03560 family F420-dependent LLM class oxidoreductase [Tenggerimyces flavus]MBM7785401.1 F420-dependent oxidoreductase-like protein [Tenggerimyces flavus]